LLEQSPAQGPYIRADIVPNPCFHMA
jgi:hypothetical protein